MPINALLESAPDVYPVRAEHHHTDTLTATILDHLNEQTVISLDSLICLMPEYTWNQIFHAVDQLARCSIDRPSPTPIRLHALFDPFCGITTRHLA